MEFKDILKNGNLTSSIIDQLMFEIYMNRKKEWNDCDYKNRLIIDTNSFDNSDETTDVIVYLCDYHKETVYYKKKYIYNTIEFNNNEEDILSSIKLLIFMKIIAYGTESIIKNKEDLPEYLKPKNNFINLLEDNDILEVDNL
jgi:hypothetical protein